MNPDNGDGLRNNITNNQITGGASILIADDNENFLALITRRVEKMGHRVVAVTDGSKAIEAIKNDKFDLLILDMQMPGVSGLDVIQSTQKYAPDLAIIVITGHGSIENAVEALRYRVFDYLTKPLESLKVFEITVHRALNQVHQSKENARLLEEIQHMAEFDPLTGLYNRHRMNSELVKEIEHAKRLKHPLSLMMVDIDGMKRINDTLGHVIGDEVLSLVGQVLKKDIRTIDIAFRFGGDEFLVINPGINGKEARVLACRIFDNIRELDFVDVDISISIGIAQWNESYLGADDFVQAADHAMYQSKNSVDQFVTVINE